MFARFWPDGLAGRVALLVLLGLALAQLVSLLFYAHDRDLAATRAFALSIADRVSAVLELMETTPPEDRPKLLRALNSPLLQVAIAEHKPSPAEPWRHADAILPTVLDKLGTLGGRAFEVQVLDFDAPPSTLNNITQSLLPGRHQLAIAVALDDKAWLTFTAVSDITRLRWGPRRGVGLGIFIALIVIAIIWSTHRMTRPLRRFAEAADRLGVDVAAPPLPEHGSRELRRATRAFNQMQERLRRLIDDRTRMLAAISHDLRTHLTRLKLRIEFIDDAEQQSKALSDIDAMQLMLESTLSFARDDNQTEARTEFDLAVLLQSLCEDFADAGHRVSYLGPERLTVNGRPIALQRAFTNLIDNAVNYGNEAKVTLSQREGGVLISVEDRGPGIPEDQREQVFAPFFRLESSRNRETGGTGLGLAVARSVARRHGGDIVLEDRPGGGLRARVTLPRTG